MSGILIPPGSSARRPRSWRSAAGPGTVSRAGVQLGHHPPGALAVKRRFVDNAIVLALTGELDLATRDLLRAALAEVGEDSPPRLVIDLSGLVFIDASGLSLLLSLANRCRTTGAILELVPGSAPIHEAFEITGLADRLPFTRPPDPRQPDA